jgi:NADPH-dependent 2,4-dienoyl-CoA reductase/sulfur reductase-like enzyme
VTILPDSVVVIGAGLAGLRTVERLRQSGFGGSITLVGREQDLPYDRPPLSKKVLQDSWAPEQTLLTSLKALQDLGVDVRLGVSAVSLDKRRIGLDDGTELHPDAVVIATGVVPRVLPGQPAGVSTLRTLTHARDLREALSSAKSLLVVGGGFIGAEVTTAARSAGVEVTVLEAEREPCARVLGDQGGALVARLFREAGVDLRAGSSVKQFVDARTVELADGEKLTADHILVSVGAVPDTEWLEGAVPLMPGGDGIITGSTGRIEPLPCVWALGDVAAWWDQPRRRNARAEHWTSAGDQATAVVADMLGLETPTPPVPYVWSDQFGLKLQVVGRPDLADRVETLKGEGTSGGAVKGTVLGYRNGDALVGVAAFGAPAALLGYREQVAAGTASITTIAVPDDE